MATNSNHSIEEQVEDWCKRQFNTQKYYTKTESINPEIEEALSKAPSKKGGSGTNFPDIKSFIETSTLRRIPVMIEVKGTKGDFVKFNAEGEVDNKKKDGESNYNNIAKYAVNGAVHYADAILKYTESYKEVVAIGVNGYKVNDELKVEIGVYYVAKSNLLLPKKVGEYSDLSFLLQKNVEEFVKRIDDIFLSKEEKERRTLVLEDDIERKLKTLNQKLHDEQDIVVGNRVQLVAGLIMAGLGVKDKVEPLRIDQLRGEQSDNDTDGHIIMRKISSYLKAKDLPVEKINMITELLNKVFLHSHLEIPTNGESRLKTVYTDIKQNILPFVTGELHNIDFTGRLFNVMNEWVDIPDGDKNDVVLTPRYVTELMAKLCKVNKDSYVWDFTVGSAGFLISAMHLMIEDAKKNSQSPKELEKKILDIKTKQLLGIEKLPDVYMLAVLNMILMKDGSANIIQGNSLEFKGNYEQGKLKDEPFPATVFLLNPPYSAPGKDMIFVQKALSMMKSGRAAVLIHEKAGSGKGQPYASEVLKHNTLEASIHMADIFRGKANVQTAIYVFSVGIPHDKQNLVKFIDFSNDGYGRYNRKKASQKNNLRNEDHAVERYEEIVKLVLYGRGKNDCNLHYFNKHYCEDYITLKGNDWTCDKHKEIEKNPNASDFADTVKNYLDWLVSDKIRMQNSKTDPRIQKVIETFLENGGTFKDKKASDFFVIKSNSKLDKGDLDFSEGACYPYFTRTVANNGIMGYVHFYDEAHKVKGNVLAVGMMRMQFFYMGQDFYAGQFTKTATPKFEGFNETIAQWFITWFNKSSGRYLSGLVRDFDRLFNETKISIPFIDGKIALDFIEAYVNAMKASCVSQMEKYYLDKIRIYKELIGCKDNRQNDGINQDNLVLSDTQEAENIPFVLDTSNVPTSDRFTRYLPLYDIAVACGTLVDKGVQSLGKNDVEMEGWIDVSEHIRKPNDQMFIVRAKGESMLPKIHPGDLCVFEVYGGSGNAGSREGQIVLARQSRKDNDYNCQYTIKQYHSEKDPLTNMNTKIELRPLNKDGYDPIIINPENEGEIIVLGVLKDVIES